MQYITINGRIFYREKDKQYWKDADGNIYHIGQNKNVKLIKKSNYNHNSLNKSGLDWNKWWNTKFTAYVPGDEYSTSTEIEMTPSEAVQAIGGNLLLTSAFVNPIGAVQGLTTAYALSKIGEFAGDKISKSLNLNPDTGGSFVSDLTTNGTALLGLPIGKQVFKFGKKGIIKARRKIDPIYDLAKTIDETPVKATQFVPTEQHISFKPNQPIVYELLDIRDYDLNIPYYVGEKISINDIVDTKGNVNWSLFEKVMSQIDFKTQLKDVKITAKRHKTDLESYRVDNTNQHLNVLNHLKAVVKSAQSFPIPFEQRNRQNFVLAALFHDIGKGINAGRFEHGPISARLMNEIFTDVPQEVTEAVSKHMGYNLNTPLEKAVHAANVGNGRESLVQMVQEFPKSPLKYANTEVIIPNKIKGTPQTPKKAAIDAKVIQKPVIKNAFYTFEQNQDGSYRFVNVDKNGIPLIEYNGKLIYYNDLVDQVLVDIRKKGLTKISGIQYYDTQHKEAIGILGDLPIYKHTILKKALSEVKSNTSEMEKLKEAAFMHKEKNAIHVLTNLKYLETHELEGIQIVGGKTFGENKYRFTAGQLSEIVDLYKQGFKGIITPVLKGSGNDMRRSGGFKVSTNHDFGNRLYVTNSPKIALRYADIKQMFGKTNRDILLQGLSPEKKKIANGIMDDILQFNEEHGIKQGTQKSWTGEGFVTGTYEDFPARFYNNPKMEEALNELQYKYDQLQHILGADYLQVGGTRKGIAIIKPTIISSNWDGKTYRGHLPAEHPMKKYYDKGDHNTWITFLDQMRIKQGVTSNIGESLVDTKSKGANYGADFMISPEDFIIARWKNGGKL